MSSPSAASAPLDGGIKGRAEAVPCPLCGQGRFGLLPSQSLTEQDAAEGSDSKGAPCGGGASLWSGRGREGGMDLCGMGRGTRDIPRRDKPEGEMGNSSTANHRL